MPRYTHVLFDLDGTVTDPAPGITNSVMHALKKSGVPVPARTDLYRFIGPPLAQSFERFYGFSADDAQRAVGYYREYFGDRGLYENTPYEGIGTLLQTMRDAGLTLLLATSKPHVYAARILEHFGLAGHFSFVAGSELDGTRVDKAEVVAYALENSGNPDASRAVMVGDREHDIIGARKCGLDSVGVLYGYGSREEFREAGATYVAGTVGDVGRIVMNP